MTFPEELEATADQATADLRARRAQATLNLANQAVGIDLHMQRKTRYVGTLRICYDCARQIAAVVRPDVDCKAVPWWRRWFGKD